MSIVDRVVAAVTPLESEKDRAEARAKATAVAEPGDWLSLVLDHHIELEDALAAVEDMTTAEERSESCWVAIHRDYGMPKPRLWCGCGPECDAARPLAVTSCLPSPRRGT